MFESQLQDIGLTQGEIKVYLALLDLGETTTGRIIDQSGLSSGKIYEILDKLISKGLVTYIVKEKTKYFQPTNPKKILEYVQDQQRRIEEKQQQIESILPSLLASYSAQKIAYSAIIYKGIQGLRTALFDTLDGLGADDEWLAFGVRGDRPEPVMRIWDQWLKQRVKRRIPSKMIVANKDAYNLFKDIGLTGFRLLALNSFAPVTISGNVVLIYNWSDLSVLKITNQETASSFKELFYSLWTIGKPL